MSLLYIGFVCALFVVLAIVGPGVALAAVGHARGLLPQAGPATWFMRSAAIGFYVLALVFVGTYLVRLDLTLLPSLGIVVVVFIALAAVPLSFRIVRRVSAKAWRELVHLPVVVAAVVLFAAGAWAFWQYPHVYDSGQLLWTQFIVDGSRISSQIAPMFGFSGLIALPAALAPDLPIATLASGYKPFLLMLSGLTCWHAAESLDLRPRGLATIVAILLMVLTVFGFGGLFVTGKDSIFGLLFATAFLMTIARSDSTERGIELGLYLTAAATLGIIAIPFLMVAYGLWLLLAGREAWRTVTPVYLVGLPLLPLVLAGFSGKPALVMFGAYLVAGLAVLAVRWALHREILPPRLNPLLAAGIPVLCFAAAALLMPVNVLAPVYLNPDGTMFMRSTFPTDGKTTLIDMMLGYGHQALTVGLGTVVMLTVGASGFGRERPGIVAVAAAPFIVICFVILQYRAGLGLLNPTFVWDLVKDVPQWLGGSLIAIFAVLGGVLLGGWVPNRFAKTATLCSLALMVTAYAVPQANLDLRPNTFSAVTGSTTPDVAVVAEHAWRELKGHKLYLDPNTLVSQEPHFYDLQMYMVTPRKFGFPILDQPLPAKSGFVVRDDVLPVLVWAAKANKASLRRLAQLSDSSLYLVTLDGRATIDLPEALLRSVGDGSVQAIEGVYPQEFLEDGTPLRWLRGTSVFQVALPAGGGGCLVAPLFATGLPANVSTVVLDLSGQSTRVDLAGSHIRNRKVVKVPLPSGMKSFTLTIKTEFPEAAYPRDPRPFGLGVGTMQVRNPEAC